MNNIINNARLNALKEAFENAYDNIYTFSACADGTVSLMPLISNNSPITNDVIECRRYTEALKVVKQISNKTTVKQAIGLIDQLIAHYNLQDEITVHTPDSVDYDALMNNLDINPDYSIYNVKPLGEVSVIYYEDRPTAIVLDDADVDDIIGSIMDLNRIFKKM